MLIPYETMRISILFVLLITSSIVFCQETPQWELHSQEDGLSIYLRKSGEKGCIEVKMELQINADIPRILSFVNNTSTYPDWVHRCAEAKRLETINENDFYYSSIVDMPLTLSDREVVARVQQHQEASGRFIRNITSVPNYIPETKGKQRIQRYESSWVLTPLSDQRTQIVCQVFSDAGSGLPGWIRKQVITSGPAKSMLQLAALAEE